MAYLRRKSVVNFAAYYTNCRSVAAPLDKFKLNIVNHLKNLQNVVSLF